jgi:hypothetical protein
MRGSPYSFSEQGEGSIKVHMTASSGLSILVKVSGEGVTLIGPYTICLGASRGTVPSEPIITHNIFHVGPDTNKDASASKYSSIISEGVVKNGGGRRTFHSNATTRAIGDVFFDNIGEDSCI